MSINVNFFSSVGRRTLLPFAMPEGSTVQDVLNSAQETLPANCEVFVGGNPARMEDQLPANVNGAPVTVTVNQKTKGN